MNSPKQTYAQQFASKGGRARAAKLSKSQRSAISRQAASARWAGHTKIGKKSKLSPSLQKSSD